MTSVYIYIIFSFYHSQAVQTTGSISVEAAITWVFENADMSAGGVLSGDAQVIYYITFQLSGIPRNSPRGGGGGTKC